MLVNAEEALPCGAVALADDIPNSHPATNDFDQHESVAQFDPIQTPFPATGPSAEQSANTRLQTALLMARAPGAVVLLSVPWLAEGYAWCAWLGVAMFMSIAIGEGIASRFWTLWLACSCVLGAAFHWSPASMAYTLSSGIALGFAVAAPLFIWDGLRMALGFWLAAKFTRDVRFYWIAAAAVTILLEYIMPGVFPWKLGLTQLSFPWLLQGVDLFGPSFSTLVTFAIAGAAHMAAIGVWVCITNRPHASQSNLPSNTAWSQRLLLSPVAFFLVATAIYNSFAWAYWNRASDNAPKITLGLVQVDPSFVESTDQARTQSQRIAEQVDLMCWPESSGGTYDLDLKCLADDERTFELSRDPERGLRPWPSPKCELLLGGKNYVGKGDEPDELYVTAMLLDASENITARHNKRFLMPFGEYVPGENYVPGLSQLFDMAEYITPGESAVPIESKSGARIGTMLCFEDMVPRAAREMVASRANLLVSLVNGSAFESHFTLYQHRMISHLRAIECRRYFVRCAATGETCIIDPLGRIVSRLPMQTNGALVGEVGLMDQRSVYGRFPWMLPILGTVGGIVCLRQARSTSIRRASVDI